MLNRKPLPPAERLRNHPFAEGAEGDLLLRLVEQNADRLVVVNALDGLGQERGDGEDFDLGDHFFGG